jgi:hypothetical protein
MWWIELMITTWKRSAVFYCLLVSLPIWAAVDPQASPPAQSLPAREITVPVQVAALIRPILDEKQKGGQQGERRLSNLLYGLSQQKGRAADEALVVLMCFDVGESQEETDAVIARGRKMLPLLRKYQGTTPRIPGRSYPGFMLKGASAKSDSFGGAVKAIKLGWHSTTDNPQG